MPRQAGKALHDGLCGLFRHLAADVLQGRHETLAKGRDGLDFVTSIDLAIQSRLERALPDLLPGSRVVGEEGFSGLHGWDGQIWLVDPLDGTVNFVAGLPSYSMSGVLLEDGEPVLAVVHDIPGNVTYSARAGGGAFRDTAPLVRRDHPARLGIVSSGLLADLNRHSPEVLTRFLADYKLRNFGSQALHLCHAAAGHVSVVASREAKGWDDLAGALIATEAGLRYGHYCAAPPSVGEDQYSLCAPRDIFDLHKSAFGRSIARPDRTHRTRTTIT